MLEGYAEYYSAELSQKVRRGMNETRLKGNYTGGHILYGYKKQDKKLVIDEERAEVVRFIFEQYSIGVYVKNILLELDRRGVTYKGKPFVRSTVYNILKNEKYAGIYHFNGQVIENMFPQIVPTDIFEKVRAKVQKNHYGKRSVQVVYLLRNNVICANGQHKILKAAELNVDQSRNPISDYGFPINLFFIINLQSISAFTCNKRAKCATLFAIVKHGLFS